MMTWAYEGWTTVAKSKERVLLIRHLQDASSQAEKSARRRIVESRQIVGRTRESVAASRALLERIGAPATTSDATPGSDPAPADV